MQHPVEYLELNLEPPLASNVSLVHVVCTSVVRFFGFAITLVPAFLLKTQYIKETLDMSLGLTSKALLNVITIAHLFPWRVTG